MKPVCLPHWSVMKPVSLPLPASLVSDEACVLHLPVYLCGVSWHQAPPPRRLLAPGTPPALQPSPSPWQPRQQESLPSPPRESQNFDRTHLEQRRFGERTMKAIQELLDTCFSIPKCVCVRVCSPGLTRYSMVRVCWEVRAVTCRLCTVGCCVASAVSSWK